MDDRKQKLETIAEKYVERQGGSKGEAISVLDALTIVTKSFLEAFRPLAKEATKAWSDVKDLIRSILDRKDKNSYDDQENWIISWDTRKQSLVISNRPQHIVRKIIR